MGFMVAMGSCYVCSNVFSFNPHAVPSMFSKTSGTREPICEQCFTLVNAKRRERGLDPFPLLPNAYDVTDEDEL